MSAKETKKTAKAAAKKPAAKKSSAKKTSVKKIAAKKGSEKWEPAKTASVNRNVSNATPKIAAQQAAKKPASASKKKSMGKGKPLADYAHVPTLEEYSEWFKAFADFYREDGILQVTWKTNDGPMHHSGMSHRAIGQLVRQISMDWENEIIIFTHVGDHWMVESDVNGWYEYSELPRGRFQHQYFDDTNLIKNMIFDLDVPTIGAIPGFGFHWDSAMLCDVTICTESTKLEVPHVAGMKGLVPGDGMGLMAQHYFGTKRGNYYMTTARQFTAGEMLDWGMVSEVVPDGKALDRAWEIARMWKLMPYENRTIMANLAKRPLKKLFVEDLKLHTVSEQYGTMLQMFANPEKDNVAGERFISKLNDWRFGEDKMMEPATAELWATMLDQAAEYFKKMQRGEIENQFEFEHSNEPDYYELNDMDADF